MRALTVLSLIATSALLASFGARASEPDASGTLYASRAHVPTSQFPIPQNHPYLRTATDENFRQLIVENTMPVVVCFYKKGDRLSQSVSKGMEQTALALRPLVDVIVMDGELEGAKNLLSTYGIESVPVILHFNSDLHPIPQAPNQWAKLPEGYQGDGTAGSLVRWSLGHLSATTVERVTDDHTLSHFLSVHDHLAYPKVLLVTDDSSNVTAPLFLSMAQKMRKVAVFGVAHNVKEVIDRYHITSFPTVLGFVPEDSLGSFTLTKLPPFPSEAMVAEEAERLAKAPPPSEESEEEKKRKKEEARKERRSERLRKRGLDGVDDAPAAASAADVDMSQPNLLYGDVEYEQALADFKHFESWVDTIGIPENKRHEYGMLVATEEEHSREKAKEMAKWAAATEPQILSTREDWMKHCLKLKSKGVCIVIFRDMGDFSSDNLDKSLNVDLYRNISRKAAMRSQTSLQICVADGTTNHKLVSALGITNGVPDMVALWPAKNKYYNFLGAINERNILNLFLDKALKDKNGKKLVPADLPVFLKTGQSEVDEGEDALARESDVERPSGDDDEISDEM